ncbi:MAG: cytochrome c oxidase subunit II [Burkholderiales bacterium]|nr:cytochrome c oxidase subunit II [Phycisphaerae bacterium]
MFGTLADTSNFLLPTRAASIAAEIDWLTWFIVWVCIIFGGIVFLGTVYIAIRFRHRKGGPERGSGATHSTFLEIFWSVIPAVICLMIAIWGFQGYVRFNVQPPGEALEILVEGQKWSWTFTYPNGLREQVLHIPKDVPVRFVLSSTDVIHSLYFPEFRIKKDVVPGRYNKMWVTATEVSTVLDGSPLSKGIEAWSDPDNFVFDTGVDKINEPQDGFDIYCAEYCGTKHAKMLSKVYVHPTQASFNQWLANASDPFRADSKGNRTPTTKIGQKLSNNNGCFSCHTVDGGKGIGPTWKDMFGKQGTFADGTAYTADENYIRESIEYPNKHVVAGFNPAMPTYLGKIKPAEYTAIMSYMKSISANFKGSSAELDLPPAEIIERDKKAGGANAPATQPAAPATQP